MSLAKKVFQSSILLVGAKTFQRLVGLISIIILARLLTPDDFAIVALIAIVIHFFDIVSNTGSEQYIIQKESVSSNDLNTAWTIDIIMKVSIWLVLQLSAQFIAIFFENEDLANALHIASLVLLINAVKNPGLYLLKQQLNYNKIFWLSIFQKIIAFVITISIAIGFNSYWALIIGDIVACSIFTLGTYIIHEYRPKLSLVERHLQWVFSKWLLFKSIVGYIRSQIDTLMVSKFYLSNQLGQYYMARDIAMMPSHNLLLPAIEPLLALFKTSRNEPKKFAEHINFCLFIVALVSIPLSVFICNYSGLIIDSLLGKQWQEASQLLSIMSIMFLYFSYVIVIEKVLIALNKVKLLFWYDLVSLLFIILALWLAVNEPITTFALVRGVAGLFMMLILLVYTARVTQVNLFKALFIALPILCTSLLAIQVANTMAANYEYAFLNLLQVSVIYFSMLISIILLSMKLLKNKMTELNSAYLLLKKLLIFKRINL
jgi:lipopolysaccharide exporter